ncbi:hypothetical protein NBRC116588_14030 [Pyruvatibacter sp. HU-CL02332]
MTNENHITAQTRNHFVHVINKVIHARLVYGKVAGALSMTARAHGVCSPAPLCKPREEVMVPAPGIVKSTMEKQ